MTKLEMLYGRLKKEENILQDILLNLHLYNVNNASKNLISF